MDKLPDEFFNYKGEFKLPATPAIKKAMDQLAAYVKSKEQAMQAGSAIINIAFSDKNCYIKVPRFIKNYSRIDHRFANRSHLTL